jgi:hypothetical protein
MSCPLESDMERAEPLALPFTWPGFPILFGVDSARFHIADFPAMFATPAFGASQVTIPKFNPQIFSQTVERERISHTVFGSDDDQFC